MGAIATAFVDTFRDFVTDGVPASGAHKPSKEETRSLGAMIEASLGVASLGGVDVTKDTRANLNADLAWAADSVGLVYADATDANNDLYIKVGGTGTGSWTLTTILHDVIEGAAAEWVALAEAWAEGTEPGGPGTKSSKEYSEDAEGFADAAAASALAAAALPAFLTLGIDPDTGTTVTSGDTTGNTSTAGATLAIGNGYWSTKPQIVTSISVRLSALGDVEFHFISAAGHVFKVIEAAGLASGENTFTDFAPFYLPPGYDVFCYPVSGGRARYDNTVGTANYYLIAGFPGEGGTVSLVSIVPGTVAISRTGIEVDETVTTKLDQFASTLGMTATTYGQTTDYTHTGGSNFVRACPIPAPSKGWIDRITINAAGALIGNCHILVPTRAGSSRYRVAAIMRLAINAAGEQSIDIDPVEVEEGSLVAWEPISGSDLRVDEGRACLPFLVAGFAGAIVGTLVDLDPNDANIGNTRAPCLSYRLSALPRPIEPPSATNVIGPVPLIETAFAALPAGCTAGANCSFSGVSVAGSGANITDLANAVICNTPSSARKRIIEGRFKAVVTNKQFALQTISIAGNSQGGRLEVDGAAGVLRLTGINQDGSTISSTAVTAALPGGFLVAGQEYLLRVEINGTVVAAKVVDCLTQTTVTLADDLTNGNGIYRKWNGRPSVAMTGTNSCSWLRAYTNTAGRVRTVISGDSNYDGGIVTPAGASWANLLADGSRDVLNTSRASDKVYHAFGNLSADVLLLRPEYWVIGLGTNDAADASAQTQWRRGIKTLIEIAVAWGITPILVTYPPYAAQQANITLFNTDILASYFGDYTVIDLAAPVSTGNDRVTVNATYSSDALHINAAGHLLLKAQALIDAPFAFPLAT